ncbi:MAG TPA: N-6 DNA methylase [Acidobacteriota bacterium]|nr:N-6 DNA methylase [Acidobacteriota bacterium]
MGKYHQKLPASGPAREALRQKGQFWTPAWVAEAMVSYVIDPENFSLFDPAVGDGVFFQAAQKVAFERGQKITLFGTEIDPEVLPVARQKGVSETDLAGVQIRDFVLDPPSRAFPAIVGNPPYIRHHRLTAEVKSRLRRLATETIGADGRAGLHVYFLIQALRHLSPRGRLAFIVPADICEGKFAPRLWDWVTRQYCLEAVMNFVPEASPFPGVDTNALVFFIRNEPPQDHFCWGMCLSAQTSDLKQWVESGFSVAGQCLKAETRCLDEALKTGFSRPPQSKREGPVLGDFARVMRGIATGANEYFFLTRKQATELDLPDDFLVSAVGRTRDATGDEITQEHLQQLDRADVPTWLFSPDGRDCEQFPSSVKAYLKHGEQLGIHHRTLIATRRPWYKMETRAVPPFLFAYLGRRSVRFIRNSAGVLPLTGFLCVYPFSTEAEFLAKFWKVLQHPETIANLALVGKSYGSGAIKVEPRALEKLQLPVKAMEQAGLPIFWQTQPAHDVQSQLRGTTKKVVQLSLFATEDEKLVMCS